MQSAEEQYFVGQLLAGLECLLNGRIEPSQRNLSQGDRRIEIGRQLVHHLGTQLGQLALRFGSGIFEQAVGIDRDTTHRALVTKASDVIAVVVLSRSPIRHAEKED